MRPRAKCKAMGCADLFVVASDNFQLWLLNPAANEVACDAFEIFGFNVASYTEKAAGNFGNQYVQSVMSKAEGPRI